MDYSIPFRTFFDFAYYLCLCPFHFAHVHVSPTNQHKSQSILVQKSWAPQAMICCLNWLLLLLDLACDIVTTVPRTPEEIKRPQQYLTIILHLTFFAISLITMKTFWFRRRLYFDIVSYLKKLSFNRTNGITGTNMPPTLFPSVPNQATFILRKGFVSLIYFVYVSTVMAYILVILIPSGFVEECEWYHVFHWDRQQIGKCFNFNSTIASWLLLSLSTVGRCQKEILIAVCRSLLLTCAITLWSLVKSFVSSLSNSIQRKEFITSTIRKEGFEGQLQILREFTKMLTKVVGHHVTLELLVTGLTFGISFIYFAGQGASAEPPGGILKMIVAALAVATDNGVSVAFLWLSADICSQVKVKVE